MDGTENDISNIPISSSHRLPTISASEAIRNAAQKAKGIPTGLSSLDAKLQPTSSTSIASGGIQRGQLTEIYGPPGVGKSTFGIQLAVNTVYSHDPQSHVVWVDTGTPLAPRRLRQILNAYRLPEAQEPTSSLPECRTKKQLREKMSYFNITSLPHLLTLFLHPTSIFPAPNTALIIIDDLSRLLNSSFPRSAKLKKATTANVNLSAGLRDKLAKRAMSRKWTIISELGSAMSKMAALRNIAILAFNQTATSMKAGRKAALKSALSAIQGWNTAVGTRVLLYRDFLPADLIGLVPLKVARGLRFVEASIAGGKVLVSSEAIMFYITNGGLRELNRTRILVRSESNGTTSSPVKLPVESAKRLKRKADEIADSDNEDDEEIGLSEGQESVLKQVEGGGTDDLGLPVEGDPIDEDEALDEAEEDEDEEGQAPPAPFQPLSDEDLTPDEDDQEPP